MIPEIAKSSAITLVIDYHETKIKQGSASLIYDGTYSETGKERAQVLIDTVNLNHRIRKNKALHLSVSFNHNDRKISDNEIQEIGERYLDEIGYKNTPYIIYKHNDTKHQHFHVVASTIDYDGKKIKDYNDYKISEQLARKLENDYNLEKTLYIGKDRANIKEINKIKFRTINAFQSLAQSKQSTKELSKLIGSDTITQLTLLDSQITSDQELVKQLGEHQFNQLYTYLDEKGFIERSYKTKLIEDLDRAIEKTKSREEYLNYLKSQDLYVRFVKSSQSFVYGNRQRSFYIKEKFLPTRHSSKYLFNNNYLENLSHKKQKQFIKNCLKRSLRSSASLSVLESRLSLYNIDIEYHSNSSGVFGISFKSSNIKSPVTFKGSEIGKDFTYKSIVNNLSNKIIVPKATKTKTNFVNNPKHIKDLKDLVKNISKGTGGKNDDQTNDYEEQQKRKRKRNRNIDDSDPSNEMEL